ncbi:hypothetical protein H5407_11050 [Mitsuaria sp. WAJ17]|uniref:hypothetical protein n=1 Tax=Mitsuaria sp. WAJ17 TaxID=2761452 RepID=UPI001601907C|nr:hypothetical protein [Mitsuaria sp. WAJ17]MBB2485756.1 hypothetical protein [Mitsuaria sp. WAJ17]
MLPRSPASWWLLGAGLACLAPAAQAACVPAQLDLGLGVQASRWHEEGGTGERLLEERGTLRAGSLAVSGPCAGLHWVAQLDLESGTRDYQGRSSAGAPLSTLSRVRSQRLQLQAWHPIEGSAWALGARLAWEPDSRRALASVGAVQGYEESRERWRLGLGARWRHALPSDWEGRWEAWLDSGPRARLSLDGEAFGSRTVRLDEGRWESLALAWTLGPASRAGRWQPWLGWRWESLRTRISAPVAVKLDSGRLLAVSQPAYRQSDWRLMAGLRFTME